jgi:uncharacterized membrane protein YhhN
MSTALWDIERMPLPYVVVCAADLALTAFGRGRVRRLRWLTKPLLMPVLVWSMHLHRRRSYDRLVRRTVTGLGLSTAGDVALLRHDDKGFLGGLAAFLGAHLAYVSAFSTRRRSWGSPGTAGRVAPVVAVWATVLPSIAAKAGPLRAPVGLYGTAIAGMQMTALMLDTRLSAKGRTRIALGAAVFMVSDALLGAQRFLLPSRYDRTADVGVMATYVTAQWLIADGVRRVSETEPGQVA